MALRYGSYISGQTCAQIVSLISRNHYSIKNSHNSTWFPRINCKHIFKIHKVTYIYLNNIKTTIVWMPLIRNFEFETQSVFMAWIYWLNQQQ
jgi:hypothetical protein